MYTNRIQHKNENKTKNYYFLPKPNLTEIGEF